MNTLVAERIEKANEKYFLYKRGKATRIQLLLLSLFFVSCTFTRIMKRKDFNLHYCFKESKIPLHTKGVYYHVREVSDEERKSGYGWDTYFDVECIRFYKDGTCDEYGFKINRRVIDKEIVEERITKLAKDYLFVWPNDGAGVYFVSPDDSVKMQVWVTLPYLVNTGVITRTGYFENDSTYIELGSKINWGKKRDRVKPNPEPKKYTFLPIDIIPDVSAYWFKKKHWYRKKLNSCP